MKGEETQANFVGDASEKGSQDIHTSLCSGNELVSNIQLAAENLQIEHRKGPS